MPKLYCITDKLSVIEHALSLNVDMIQIRAKGLPTRDLVRLVKSAVAMTRTPILVNTRVDVAIACGAAGVHLPSYSVAPRRLRTLAPAGFLIGVSCHQLSELRAAEREGADFAVYGPIFATGDKQPMGLQSFAEDVRQVNLPVYALGGITWANAKFSLAAGAAGVAGISLFEPKPDLQSSEF